MKTLEYVAVDAAGVSTSGRAFAESELELDHALEQRGLTLCDLREVDATRTSRARAMKTDELIAFTSQLATIVGAGIPLLEGLTGIGRRLESSAARALVEDIVRQLEAGESLSRALEAYPGTFSPIYRASIRAGELTGALDVVLRQLAKYMEWSRSISGSVVQALIYPCIILLAILGLIVVLLTFVLPRLVQVFPGGRETLPTPTRIVLALSDFMRGNCVLLGVAAVASTLAAVWFIRRPRGRYYLHAGLLRVPRLGKLLRQIATSRFASTAAVLQSAGCDVITMLDTAARSSGNAVIEAAFGRVVTSVKRGSSISDGLAAEKDVDPLLGQLIAVGEKTGKLEHCLKEVVSYYDEEIPRSVKKSMALIEPALLIGAGLVVGFIVYAAISPLFKMYENL